jgi:hypothetical protein
MNAPAQLSNPQPVHSVTTLPRVAHRRSVTRHSLRGQLAKLHKVLARIEDEGAVVESIHLEGLAQPCIQLSTNGYCQRLRGHRYAFGQDRDGAWERWEARIGSILLHWELRGRALVARYSVRGQ